MTHDYIVKSLAFDGEIRAYAALTTESVQEAQTRHYTSGQQLQRYGQNNDSNFINGFDA